MIKLSRKLLTVLLIILFIVLIYTFSHRRIIVNYSGAMTVESNKILKSYDTIVLDGMNVLKLDFLNLKIDSTFYGKLTVDGRVFDITQCGIADRDKKNRYFGIIEERTKSSSNSYVLVMSKNFEYICIYDRSAKTYTIAPVKTIEDYYKIDKLIN